MNPQFTAGLLRGAILAAISAGSALAVQLGVMPPPSNRAILAAVLAAFFTSLAYRLLESGYDATRAKTGKIGPGDVGFNQLAQLRDTQPLQPPTTSAIPTYIPKTMDPFDGVLPDPRFTPGMINPDVTQANIKDTIALPGWTASIRPPVSVTRVIKQAIMSRDGLTDPPSAYELDHLIPLELGGHPTDTRNLWCQHREDANHTIGAGAKDRTENALHALVLSGRLALDDARRRIATNWYEEYVNLGKAGLLPPVEQGLSSTEWGQSI